MSKYQEGQEWVRKCGKSYAHITFVGNDSVKYEVYDIETGEFKRDDGLPNYMFKDFYPELKDNSFEVCKNKLRI